jgi:tetratricopeptide (TPR) repeat protein
MNPANPFPEDDADDSLDSFHSHGDLSRKPVEFGSESAEFMDIDEDASTESSDDEFIDIEAPVETIDVSASSPNGGIIDIDEPVDDDPAPVIPRPSAPTIVPDPSPKGSGFFKMAGVGAVCAALSAGLMFAFVKPADNPSTNKQTLIDTSKKPEKIDPGSGEIPRQATIPNDAKIQELLNAADPEASLFIPFKSLSVLMLVGLQDVPKLPLSSRQEAIIKLCDDNIKLDNEAIEKFKKNPSQLKDVAERQYHLAWTYAIRANVLLPKNIKEATEDSEKANAAFKLAEDTEKSLKLSPGENKVEVTRSRSAALDRIQPLKERIADANRLVAFANDIGRSLNPEVPALTSVDGGNLKSLTTEVSKAVEQREKAKADLLAYQKITVPGADPASPGDPDQLTKAINDLETRRAEIDKQLLDTNEKMTKLSGDLNQFVTFARELNKRFDLTNDPDKMAAEWFKEADPKVKRTVMTSNNIAQQNLEKWVLFAAKEHSILNIKDVQSPTADQNPSDWIAKLEGAITNLVDVSQRYTTFTQRYDYVERTWAGFAANIAAVLKYKSLPSSRWSNVPDLETEKWLRELVDAVPTTGTGTGTENPKTKAGEFYALGLAAFQGREYDSALVLFDKAITLYPRDARYFYYRGLAKHLRPLGKSTPTPVDAASDMKAGYKLELANSPGPQEVESALMPVQLETRDWVETFRNPTRVPAESAVPVSTSSAFGTMPISSPTELSRTSRAPQPWWNTLWPY